MSEPETPSTPSLTVWIGYNDNEFVHIFMHEPTTLERLNMRVNKVKEALIVEKE